MKIHFSILFNIEIITNYAPKIEVHKPEDLCLVSFAIYNNPVVVGFVKVEHFGSTACYRLQRR